MNERQYDATSVPDAVRQHGARPERLLQILQTLAQHHGWISEAAIRELADALNLSRADVHGVVSFYHDLRTSPPGRHVVRVCQAEACQAMGSRELTRHVSRVLGVKLHGSSEAVTLEPVYCLGNCACAPAIMVDGKTHGRVTAGRADELLAALEESAS